jgi:hypothetical protein
MKKTKKLWIEPCAINYIELKSVTSVPFCLMLMAALTIQMTVRLVTVRTVHHHHPLLLLLRAAQCP